MKKVRFVNKCMIKKGKTNKLRVYGMAKLRRIECKERLAKRSYEQGQISVSAAAISLVTGATQTDNATSVQQHTQESPRSANKLITLSVCGEQKQREEMSIEELEEVNAKLVEMCNKAQSKPHSPTKLVEERIKMFSK